jgi:DNA invertase Pin-like site-specific DNA recombinase
MSNHEAPQSSSENESADRRGPQEEPAAAAHTRAVAEAKGRHIGRPTAWPADKIDYARLLREQGNSLGEIASKTGIPKTSLHRYLTPATHTSDYGGAT